MAHNSSDAQRRIGGAAAHSWRFSVKRPHSARGPRPPIARPAGDGTAPSRRRRRAAAALPRYAAPPPPPPNDAEAPLPPTTPAARRRGRARPRPPRRPRPRSPRAGVRVVDDFPFARRREPTAAPPRPTLGLQAAVGRATTTDTSGLVRRPPRQLPSTIAPPPLREQPTEASPPAATEVTATLALLSPTAFSATLSRGHAAKRCYSSRRPTRRCASRRGRRYDCARLVQPVLQALTRAPAHWRQASSRSAARARRGDGRRAGQPGPADDAALRAKLPAARRAGAVPAPWRPFCSAAAAAASSPTRWAWAKRCRRSPHACTNEWPLLVCCPSTARWHWRDELLRGARADGDRRARRHHHRARGRRQRWPPPAARRRDFLRPGRADGGARRAARSECHLRRIPSTQVAHRAAHKGVAPLRAARRFCCRARQRSRPATSSRSSTPSTRNAPGRPSRCDTATRAHQYDLDDSGASGLQGRRPLRHRRAAPAKADVIGKLPAGARFCSSRRRRRAAR